MNHATRTRGDLNIQRRIAIIMKANGNGSSRPDPVRAEHHALIFDPKMVHLVTTSKQEFTDNRYLSLTNEGTGSVFYSTDYYFTYAKLISSAANVM